jgi:hypothetical protein
MKDKGECHENEDKGECHVTRMKMQGCGGVPPPPPPPLEPAPELRSEGERSGSALPSSLPERSSSGAFLGSAIPP